jgi:hypothetical protein
MGCRQNLSRRQTHSARMALAACLWFVSDTPVRAQDNGGALPSPLIRAAAGLWDLSLANTDRRCAITLGMVSSVTEQPLRFPAPCRKALPVLAEASYWKLASGRRLVLLGREARPLLVFDAGPQDTVLWASAVTGESYRLEPRQKSLAMARPVSGDVIVTGASQIASAPSASASSEAKPSTAAPLAAPVLPAYLRPSVVPGFYSVDRGIQRNICYLELMAGVPDIGRLAKVRVIDSCRDERLSRLKPLSWTLEQNELVLAGQEGDSLRFQRNGRIWIHPQDYTFILRALE